MSKPAFVSLSKRYQEHKAAQPTASQLPDMQATLTVAASMIVTSYAYWFGAVPILFYYALWFSRTWYKGTFALRPSKEIVPGVMFALLVCASALWSQTAGQTLYTGLEFASTIACAIIMARVIPLPSLIKGIAWGTVVVLLIAIASGRYSGDPFSSRYALVGYFGSKNTVGLYADIALIAALPLFWFSKGWSGERWLGVLTAIIGFVALVQSRSSSSVLALLTAWSFLVLVRFVHVFRAKGRSFLFVLALIVIASIVLIGLAMGWQNVLFEATGRDATLTGRTYLWEKGIEIGMRNPFLGQGYNAFWTQGNPDAEFLWDMYFIPIRGGFHFHNTYVQMFVDFGFAGFALIGFIMIRNLVQSTRLILKERPSLVPVFCFSFSVLFFTRSFVEIDVVGPFGLLGMVFYMFPILLSAQKPEAMNG